MGNVDDGRTSTTQPSGASAYLGLGVVASALGFAFLFTDDPSFGFKVGSSLGQVLGPSILALPLFLIWRFATKHGRIARLAKAFNVFCFVLVAVWFLLFVVAKNLLPSFIAGYEAGRTSVHQRNSR